MARLLQSLKCLCLAAGCFALVAVGWSARQVSRETAGLAADARGALAMLRTYSEEQIARLRDPRQQKALDAAVQLGAVFNGTGRLINREVIPRTMAVLEEMRGVAGDLRSLTSSVQVMVSDDLAPGISGTFAQTQATLAELGKTLSAAQGGVELATKDIHAVLADPALGGLMASLSRASENLAEMSASGAEVARQAAEASRQMPSIAASVEKVAATSSKLSKAMIVSQILLAVARALVLIF